MEPTLANVMQALVLAVCTWYMRRGSVRDREDVKKNTSTPDDVAAVRKDLAALRAEFDILKCAFFKSGLVKIDHRGPLTQGEKKP